MKVDLLMFVRRLKFQGYNDSSIANIIIALVATILDEPIPEKGT